MKSKGKLVDKQFLYTHSILIHTLYTLHTLYTPYIHTLITHFPAFISYFTVTIPLIIIPVMFIRVCFLDGALFGFQTFITPDLDQSSYRVAFPILLLDTTSQVGGISLIRRERGRNRKGGKMMGGVATLVENYVKQ